MKISLLLFFGLSLSAQRNFDVVVYGATAAGFTTAVEAARHGQKTVLLEPHNHVGGMATGGLSRTDVGRREVIGGMALEFYYRAGLRYDMQRFNNPIAWFHEPKIGEETMRAMLKDAGVEVLFQHRLKEQGGVVKVGSKVTEITMTNGARFAGKVFADCSYEGDLMAQAKVTYTYGRESSGQYGESLGGVRDRTPKHQFAVELSPKGSDGKIMAEISEKPVAAPGSADKGIQAYNFRIIATNVAANRIPWPKPTGYDAKRYELLAKFLEADTKRRGRPPVFHEMTLIAPIPNGKADFNNNGPFSTDYIGKNYGYPEGSYAERDRIWEDHVRYVQGYYYFLAHDPRVPKLLQDEVNSWGLPKDEYLDTNHWPHQLYVREARRMVGEYVVIQKDLQTDREKQDVIGMGSYNSDSHNIQRIINSKGFVENEGDMQVSVQPYQIPYRMLIPRKAEVTNLIVPVCFSASHVAYSSLRMEPQYMILGHAAGLAASMAIEKSQAIQDIDVAALQATLKKEGAVYTYVETDQSKAFGVIRDMLRPKGIAKFNWE